MGACRTFFQVWPPNGSIYFPLLTGVDCGPLDYPEKGEVSLSGTTVGSVATYSCEAGYALDGGIKRECLASGIWSGTAPTCISKRNNHQSNHQVLSKIWSSLLYM